ncbi:DNA/RNA helicase, superfamily I [Corynebacterium mustelae]|uniref:DNA 3'-5' helicase n=2 Tax=Corynebacterium mustelae TaxID=571915 RepID=A0A0G3GXB2_9CORY|nr:DNA/RNA helicase, superfamily I [Corynebacterium mustelae]
MATDTPAGAHNAAQSTTLSGGMPQQTDTVDPIALSGLLGQKFPPTPQQADVIESELGPLLVVAGAGAGKTETMAARVVWLVANGLIEPERVLGLTFTRKAAQQLSKRIRTRLEQLAGIPDIGVLDPSGKLVRSLTAIAPTVSTYDAFAGKLIGEFGLMLPVEPSSRVITNSELFRIAYSIVETYGGVLTTSNKPATVVETLLALVSELDSHMVSAKDVWEETTPFVELFDTLPKGPRQRDALNQTMQKWKDTQQTRLEYLPLAQALKDHLLEKNLTTFGEQMSLAARLAQKAPEVGKTLRNRFQVVLLDEYQDTSHAQRVLLSTLFAGSAVTAVGDPMQSIYGWRGATAANLERFVTDFAADGAVAPKKELTMSFRNPPRVLALANAVSATVLGPATDPRRPVQPLESLPDVPAGDVALGFFATGEAEREFIADQLATEYHDTSTDEPFTAAVLVRKRAHMAAMALELHKRGVPVEIVGLGGLLDIPEVADMVAIATMLIRPTDSQAALRILAGPMVGLGVADITALAKRAANLAGRSKAETVDTEVIADPMEKLTAIINQTVPAEPETVVGLTDAIADLGEPESYSAEGYRRLMRLSGQLRALRQTVAAGQSLPDIFADIERVMGIRTEVLSRENPHTDGAAGTVHLDKLHSEVASFATVADATLQQLLDYFTIARSQDNGLTPGEVVVRSDRVQILTAHKAKGLEWKTVCVLHADNRTYAARVSTWLTNVAAVPSTLRGDVAEDGDQVGSPVFDTVSPENRSEFEKAGKEHIDAFKQGAAEENTRLFYVAITRAEQRLFVTASQQLDPESTTQSEPYENFLLLKEHAPDCVVEWFDGEANPTHDSTRPREGLFPRPAHDVATSSALMAAAARVRKARESEIPFNDDKDIFALWEKDVSALIDEHERMKARVVSVELARELTATDVVALKQNPEQFAKRQRRPVPFKPNQYAKRGTEFHMWLEERFGGAALLDQSELPGMDEEISPVQLQELKDAFVSGQFADRTPMFVEQPFEVAIDGIVIRGRMDAIFKDPDGWHIVDWKTGRPPTKADMRFLSMQLAVYRLAWAQLQGIAPQDIRASFYYVRDDELVSAAGLPSEAELGEVFAQAVEMD